MEVVPLLLLVGAWLGALLGRRYAARRNRQPAPAWKIDRVPTVNGPCEVAGVWHAYRADRISLVSALLRVDELFAARVREITDWQAIDWTTSPLEPSKGRWQWDGDRLVAGPEPLVPHLAEWGSTAAEMTRAMAAAFDVPHAVYGCRCCGSPCSTPDCVCHLCHANGTRRLMGERILPQTLGGELSYVHERTYHESVIGNPDPFRPPPSPIG